MKTALVIISVYAIVVTVYAHWAGKARQKKSGRTRRSAKKIKDLAVEIINRC